MTSASFASLAVLGLLASAWAVEPGCAHTSGASCAAEEESSLLQSKLHSEKRQVDLPEYEPRDIRGKSLYFIVTDYFANPPSDQVVPSACDGPGWCNGTIKGITSHLDYIQGMGFEGLWVTPLIKQFYGPDPDGRSGYGQYGYWAQDWYKIDPNYGTAEDLKELSRELHKRGMVFVYDIVLNHVGPVHSEAALADFFPFNKPEYLHQLGIGDMTFDEYAKGFAYNGTGYPPPVQGIGPGAMCIKGPEWCSNYHCPVDPGFGNPCPVMPTYIGEQAPGPRDIPSCGVGDLVCPGYDENQTIEGWFYDLGDLNHSHPFVHDELIKWGMYMRDTYHIDGFRLDTAPYVTKDFLSDFQAAVKIPILGEVTASNYTFFKSYAPKPSEGPVLKGLLNFYIQNVATPAFCGPPAFFPGADLNLSSLAANLEVLHGHGSADGVNDLDLLGNFVDNHDMARLALYCNNVMPRMKNALAFTMLARGIPIIYSGTEHFFNTTHPAMWNTGYATDTPGYTFIRNLNDARKTLHLQTSEMHVEAAGANRLIFSRETAQHKVYVFLNNFGHPNTPGVKPVPYGPRGMTPGFLMPEPEEGWVWVDVLHGRRAAKIVGGTFLAPDSDPAVLLQVKWRPCSSHPACAHLADNCCPTSAGVMLDCCTASTEGLQHMMWQEWAVKSEAAYPDARGRGELAAAEQVAQ